MRARVPGVIVVVASAAAALAGCGDDGGDGAPPSCLPACPATRDYDAVAYALRATYDADARVLHAEEDVTLTAVTDAIVELDAEVDVTAVRAGDQRLAYAYDEAAHALRVDLGPLGAVEATAERTFTITYDAPTSDALVDSGSRDDDPVTARVLFTDSEPERGRRWLVGKHDPADRARFAVELTVPAGDDVIANGARVRDDAIGDTRVVGYRMDQPIATYAMAFAAGALEHADRTDGPVPLAVWYRRGLAIEPRVTLDMLARQTAFFAERVGPYPWGSYAVVLLPPPFSGGMENVTVTFNAESSSQGVPNFNLHAHELAHQWFGDWVTVKTWDDLWTKEGMATFLAAEAERPERDRMDAGRTFGADFLFLTTTAVVDRALPPSAKYTDGPYGRAAWVITQLRAVVGEEAFWAGLRTILADHALGAIGSEDFVRAFAPALDEARIAQILASLEAHSGPQLAVTTTPMGAALEVALALVDPDRVLIAPIELTVVDAAGEASEVRVGDATASARVTVPAGGYAAPDERGVHPGWPRTFDAGGADWGRLSARTAPPPVESPALTAYLTRAPAHQERAIVGALAVPEPTEYRAVYDGLDSTLAQESLLTWTCAQWGNVASPNALAAVITPLVQAPPLARYNTGYMRCPIELATRALGAEYEAAASAPTAANAARLEYLISFDHGTATNFARLTRLATMAPSLRLRERALTRMVAETSSGAPRRIPAGEAPAWRAFFREQYARVTSATRLFLAWQGSVNLGDLEALPIVAPLLHRIAMSEGAQWELVCDAYRMTRSAPDAWTRFQADTMPWDSLAPAARAALADPAACAQARLRPALEEAAADPTDERVRLAPR